MPSNFRHVITGKASTLLQVTGDIPVGSSPLQPRGYLLLLVVIIALITGGYYRHSNLTLKPKEVLFEVAINITPPQFIVNTLQRKNLIAPPYRV